jgi:hypothetical protein
LVIRWHSLQWLVLKYLFFLLSLHYPAPPPCKFPLFFYRGLELGCNQNDTGRIWFLNLKTIAINLHGYDYVTWSTFSFYPLFSVVRVAGKYRHSLWKEPQVVWPMNQIVIRPTRAKGTKGGEMSTKRHSSDTAYQEKDKQSPWLLCCALVSSDQGVHCPEGRSLRIRFNLLYLRFPEQGPPCQVAPPNPDQLWCLIKGSWAPDIFLSTLTSSLGVWRGLENGNLHSFFDPPFLGILEVIL